MSLSPADNRDAAASRRDADAETRDYRAMGRDRRAREVYADNDPGFAARFLAAVDRDSAAGDRAEALADRRCARLERMLTTPLQVSPALVEKAAATRSSPAPVTTRDHRATTPQFNDGQGGSGQISPTRTGGAHAGPEGEPSAELFSLLARRRRVRQAQGMVMAARHVSAEDALLLLLQAVHPDGSTLLDAAAALVEGRRDDEQAQPVSTTHQLDPHGADR